MKPFGRHQIIELSDVVAFLVAGRDSVTASELANAIFGVNARSIELARIEKEMKALIKTKRIDQDQRSDDGVVANVTGRRTLALGAPRGGYVEGVAEFDPPPMDFSKGQSNPNSQKIIYNCWRTIYSD
jgi:hypothetical protein